MAKQRNERGAVSGIKRPTGHCCVCRVVLFFADALRWGDDGRAADVICVPTQIDWDGQVAFPVRMPLW